MQMTKRFSHTPLWIVALLVLPLVWTGCDDDDPPTGGDESPEASFTSSVNGLTVDFDASASNDPDGGTLNYSWDFGGEGTATDEGTATPSYTYNAEGSYTVTLTVTDDENETATDSEDIEVEEEDDGGTGSTNPAAYDTTGTTITVTDDGGGTGTATWVSGFTYELASFVFVNEGDELTIEPGTVIKGQPGEDTDAKALIVARGATIQANGTADNPIIFTTTDDDLNNPNDLPADARGRWGGVIILGAATLNSEGGVTQIEGIPTNEPRGEYGGSDDSDNSGTFRYVSIRYGGSDIGAANEINGLTMGGVGSGTTIEYVEVLNNQDDGFEWFGGTVNTRYLVSAFNGDDAFDIDEGHRGRHQFLFAVQDAATADHAGEHDGGIGDRGGEDVMPFATPVIYNATYIGPGVDTEAGQNQMMLFRDNFGGSYYNSIFTEFVNGIAIEDLESGEDSRARFEAEDIRIENNIFFQINEIDDISDAVFFVDDEEAMVEDQEGIGEYISGAGNVLTDPQLQNIERAAQSGLNPLPAEGSPALTMDGSDEPEGFEDVDFIGAFGDTNWADGWTFTFGN